VSFRKSYGTETIAVYHAFPDFPFPRYEVEIKD